MRVLAILLSLALTLPTFADAVEEVRQAEIAFAKAFADRDKAKFFSFVAPDAVFLGALNTDRGKDAIVKSWSRFFDGTPVAPFRWGPERVEIMANGTLGFSMGPIYTPTGEHGGYYSSVWQKQSDGSWKVVLDGPGNPPAPLAEGAAPFEEGFVAADDGVKLYYRKIGRGPTTIIAPLDYTFFDELKQFADIATVVTYDMRGRGRSGSVDTMSLDRDVKDLEAVRAHVKAEKFVPIGYSYLGKMVMLYAVAHPDRVRRIIQLGPAGNRVPIPTSAAQDTGAPPELLEKFTKMTAEGAAEKQPREYCLAFAELLRYYLVGDPKHVTSLKSRGCDHENEWPKNLMPRFGPMMMAINQTQLTDEQLATIKVPVLTIHGTKDRNAPYAGGREWVSSLPDARLVTIPGAAHAMWADDPVTTFGAIRHFIRGEWPLGSEDL